LAAGREPFFGPHELAWLALAVGGFAGAADGARQIHRFPWPGGLDFLADVTWGLASTFNGCLFHLYNAVRGRHDGVKRDGAHRYPEGFAFLPRFAITQGSVVSNLGDRDA